MRRNLGILITIGAVLLVLLLLAGLVWANSQYARLHAGEKNFLVPWLAARTFIQYGDSPYSEPAAQRAQIVYYGHVAGPGDDPLFLWIPFPIELLYFPFALISNYSWAFGLWMTVCEIALMALALLALRLTGWRPGRPLMAALLLFAVFWIFGWWSLASGGASALVGLALVGALYALRVEQDELAGALLLLPVFSPRSSGVFMILMLWWIIRHQRWRVLAGFSMLLLALVGLAFFLLPNWVVPSLHSMLAHGLYNPGFSSIGLLTAWSPTLGSRFSWLLAGGLLLLLLGEWGLAQNKDQRRFLWAVSLTLTVTPLIGIPVFPADYVLFILPLVQLLAVVTERWPHRRTLGLAGIVLASVFAVTWILPLVLAFSEASSALTGTLVLLMPFLLLIGLYWTRWWIVRPHTTMENLE